MEPYQQRVIDEKKELDDKIEKLTSFLTNDEQRSKVSDQEADRMQRQLDCMNAYSGILGERIDAFGEVATPDEDTEAED